MKAVLNKLAAAGLAFALPLSAMAQTTPPSETTPQAAQPPSDTRPSQVATPPTEPKPSPAAPKAAEPPKLVTVYGTLNVNGQWTKSNGVSSRLAVSTDSTNIGVRGGAELRYGIGATYQCETQANLDGLNTSGICGRNSRVGLTSPWGTLFYGNWDTPFKAVAYGTKADDPFGNTDVFGFQSLMGSPGFNYRSSGWKAATDTKITGFDVRASNSVGYWSPKWNGLGVKLQYSVTELEDASGDVSPQLFGAAINYDYGPVSLLAAYELHDDGFALANANGKVGAAFGSTAANEANVSSQDMAWRVGAGYQLDSPAGTTTVGVLVEQLQLQQDDAPAGAVTEFKRWAWQVGLRHRAGDHELRARYSTADSGDCELAGGGACSTAGYGAQMYTFGYAYHIAKSTQLYAYYTQIRNDRNAQYTFTIGGSPAIAGSTAKGADPQAAGLGIRFAF